MNIAMRRLMGGCAAFGAVAAALGAGPANSQPKPSGVIVIPPSPSTAPAPSRPTGPIPTPPQPAGANANQPAAQASNTGPAPAGSLGLNPGQAPSPVDPGTTPSPVHPGVNTLGTQAAQLNNTTPVQQASPGVDPGAAAAPAANPGYWQVAPVNPGISDGRAVDPGMWQGTVVNPGVGDARTPSPGRWQVTPVDPGRGLEGAVNPGRAVPAFVVGSGSSQTGTSIPVHQFVGRAPLALQRLNQVNPRLAARLVAVQQLPADQQVGALYEVIEQMAAPAQSPRSLATSAPPPAPSGDSTAFVTQGLWVTGSPVK